MTREEAIKEIKRRNCKGYKHEEMCQWAGEGFGSCEKCCYGLAIKVLEQEPFMNKPCVAHQVCNEDKIKVLDKIRAEIMQLEYDVEDVDYDYNDMPQTETIHTICREEVIQILDKYKAESEE